MRQLIMYQVRLLIIMNMIAIKLQENILSIMSFAI